MMGTRFTVDLQDYVVVSSKLDVVGRKITDDSSKFVYMGEGKYCSYRNDEFIVTKLFTQVEGSKDDVIWK